jgi:hypothetical protein
MAVIDDNRKVLGICSREEVGMLLGLRYGREQLRPAFMINSTILVKSVPYMYRKTIC